MGKIREILERFNKYCDSPKRMKELTGKYPIETAEKEIRETLPKKKGYEPSCPYSRTKRDGFNEAIDEVNKKLFE